MATKGEIYTTEIGVVKDKKGVPTVIRVDGRTYILEPQFTHGKPKKKKKDLSK